ncbi:hypothetical protein LJC22_03030 [Desulfosarcina sp. OttesenSCG-928-G10]|nr:hypothetical protein [Desulfosarcina sp. OttesenSCG-928-G10]
MKFDDLDKKMRVFETAHDLCVLPELYMVARIDGRNFSRLTKEICQFEAPFDERFRDYMTQTVRHLMNCGFSIVYGYTESDEISLLFDFNETSFSRKHRKYNSILASEAAGQFSVLLGRPAAFDCRLCVLSNPALVVDYFRWRAADAHRNALNAHCYWRLRKDGCSVKTATRKLEGMGVDEKNELLFSYGINFNDLPAWQKRGIGLYWTKVQKEGKNPLTGESATAVRRVLKTDMDLPVKDAYGTFIFNLISAQMSD